MSDEARATGTNGRPPLRIRSGTTQPGRRGGTLQVGNPGNKGGGRTRGEVRAAARQAAAIAVPRLQQIVTSKRSRNRDVIAATGVLLKFGVGLDVEVTKDEVRERIEWMMQAVRSTYPADEAEKILALMEQAWTRER